MLKQAEYIEPLGFKGLKFSYNFTGKGKVVPVLN
jgi:hypothetical protein